MKILLAGATGMLGTDLVAALAAHEVTAVGSRELDITDLEACMRAAEGIDVVINSSAYTAVDAAETDEDAAFAVNAEGARNLAEAAASVGAVLVQISTDFVFDGTATEPYAEDTKPSPISAYGRTKAAGEQLAAATNPDTIVVRTAWLYGEHGSSFPATMLRLAGDRDTLRVVDDQLGQPTWTRDLAQQIVLLLEHGIRRGIFHGTNSGEVTKFGFAQAIFEEGGLDADRVEPTGSSTFDLPAKRPAYSVLGHDAWATAQIPPMRPWREALHAAFDQHALRP